MNLKKAIYKILLFEKKNIKLLGYPFHKNEDIEPFFIVGSGRSGNTLLRRILNSHSDLYIPPETYVLGGSIKQFVLYPFVKWNHMVQLIYSNFEFNHEFETFQMKDLKELVATVSNEKREKRSLSFILDNFYKQYAKAHNIVSKRWGDKTPLNTFFMNELSLVFPKGKFIHIIRNPYDSISSYVKSGIYQDVESASKRWVDSLELAIQFGEKYPEKYIEIFYEELVNDPREQTNKICKFLDIRFEDTMLETRRNTEKLGDVEMRKHHENVTKPISTDSIGKGKKSLSDEEIMIIDKVIYGSRFSRIRDMRS